MGQLFNMTNIPEIFWFAVIYIFIGLVVQFLEPVKREMSREDLSIAFLETRGKISAAKRLTYQIVVVVLLAFIWPLVIYWIAKDSWRGS